MEYKWISISNLFLEIKESPAKYAIWFKLILKELRYKLDLLKEIPSEGIINFVYELNKINP